eukprot:COSAG02_NODE_33458_length_499_cov_5.622500_1_plen_32_part_01
MSLRYYIAMHARGRALSGALARRSSSPRGRRA